MNVEEYRLKIISKTRSGQFIPGKAVMCSNVICIECELSDINIYINECGCYNLANKDDYIDFLKEEFPEYLI